MEQESGNEFLATFRRTILNQRRLFLEEWQQHPLTLQQLNDNANLGKMERALDDMEKQDASRQISGGTKEQSLVVAIKNLRRGQLQSPEMTKAAVQQVRIEGMRRTIR